MGTHFTHFWLELMSLGLMKRLMTRMMRWVREWEDECVNHRQSRNTFFYFAMLLSCGRQIKGILHLKDMKSNMQNCYRICDGSNLRKLTTSYIQFHLTKQTFSAIKQKSGFISLPTHQLHWGRSCDVKNWRKVYYLSGRKKDLVNKIWLSKHIPEVTNHEQ